MVITARGRGYRRSAATASAKSAAGQRARSAARTFAAVPSGDAARACRHLPPGGVGYFAYDMVRQLERCPRAPRTTSAFPIASSPSMTGCWPSIICGDQVHIIASADVSAESPRKAYDRALPTSPRWKRKLASGIAAASPGLVARRWPQEAASRCTTARRTTNSSTACARAKEYIAAGDIFQVVLSQRLDFKAAGRALPDLSRAAHRQSFALHVFPEAGRPARGGRVAGDAGAGFRTQAGIPADCGHAQARRRCRRGRAPDRSSCAPTRRSAPNTSCWWTWAAMIWAG